jgi:hypothetical protein
MTDKKIPAILGVVLLAVAYYAYYLMQSTILVDVISTNRQKTYVLKNNLKRIAIL